MRRPLLRMRAARRGLAVALLAGAAASAGAQEVGRLEGTVTDSLSAAKPIAGAKVSATRLGTHRETTFVALTNDQGRFAFERLDAGEYAVGFSHALLDSLEFGGPARRVQVPGAGVARAELAVPSGRTLRTLACPGMTFLKGTGALVGVVTDADTDRPIAGAQVASMWTELSFDKGIVQAMVLERSGGTVTDSLGQYRLCGVPTDRWLLVQVQHAERMGSAVQTTIADASGVNVRHLSFSRDGTRERAVLDSAIRDTTRTLKPLAGTATLVGIVRGGAGRPIHNAQVRVVGTAPVARTDANGWFSLTGLPSGTQEIEVRELGFPVQRRPVELKRNQTVRQEIHLEGAQMLEGMRAVAKRSPYEPFETNRRFRLNGVFLTQKQIEKRHVQNTSELFAAMTAFRVVGNGPDAKVVSTRGNCYPNVVVDYAQFQDINLVPPSLIAGIEAYPTSNGAPVEFTNLCGLIRIWVKQ
ncbi:MAG TPA: carboxypeptidase-like regulatory domain-containing protein [Gemmatimonadaceae bacterium]|nr:carboxypeptidase-like regulatory domain-containing protein [Gemmatimonadaceae bacterium]